MPALLSGPELYDAIMDAIESDLTTENLEDTKEMILQASPEGRAEMAARYERAYTEFDVKSKEYEKRWMKQFHAYKHAAMQAVEQESHEADDASVLSIEASMNSAT